MYKLLFFIPFIDYLALILFTITNSSLLTKLFLYGFEATVFLLVFTVYIKYKYYSLKYFQYFNILLLILAIYFIVGVLSPENPPLLTQVVALRLFCVPFIFSIYGYHLKCIYNINHLNIINTLIKVSVVVCIYGIFELTTDIFMTDGLSTYFNKASFYDIIKGHGSGAEDPFRYSRFSFFLFKYRMTGILLEPLSTGFLFAITAVVLINNKIKKYGINNYSILLLMLFGMLLTQSRSGILFFIIVLFIISVTSIRGLLSVAIFAIISILFFSDSEFGRFFIESFSNLGGSKHQEGIMLTYDSLFNIHSSFGKGLGVIMIEESGYGFILSQLGIFGIMLFISFFLNIIYWQFNNKNIYEKQILIGGTFGVLVLLLFHYYPFSIKGFMFFWIMVGYSFYNKNEMRLSYASIYS
jgi:hypothetical protein